MYDEQTAFHYSSYRPPLHESILRRYLVPSPKPRIGLDIGCGTGHSTLALRAYGDRVIGIDPSQAMLRRTPGGDGLYFLCASAERIPLADHGVDVVTLAGSLNYIDREALGGELRRCCRRQAQILVYDFTIDLSAPADVLGIAGGACDHAYDPRRRLLASSAIEIVDEFCSTSALRSDAGQTCHLLLADDDYRRRLSQRGALVDWQSWLKPQVEAMGDLALEARIYACRYRLV